MVGAVVRLPAKALFIKTAHCYIFFHVWITQTPNYFPAGEINESRLTSKNEATMYFIIYISGLLKTIVRPKAMV
jgi:hypothetical protein